ncbi:MAG: DHHA1 domain-containing protein [Bacteroidota bacterium]
MTSVLCFYHSPCNDGSASAAALQYRLRAAHGAAADDFDIRFCPLTYTTDWDQPLPEAYVDQEVQPKHPVSEIYIVDLSLSTVKFNQILEHLRTHGKISGERPRVICIDHHKTAMEKEAELKEYCDETFIRIAPGFSGATLVWEYFNEKYGEQIETPSLLKYVADQDIWEWNLPDSKQVNATLNVLNGTVDEMEKELAWSMRAPEEWLNDRRLRGSAIVSMVESQVHRSMKHVAEMETPNATLLIVNATSFSSELGNHLCEHHEKSPNAVAAIFMLQSDWAVRCSLRSIPGGRITAREIAEKFGGGGHDHAAGCRFPSYEKFREALEELRR